MNAEHRVGTQEVQTLNEGEEGPSAGPLNMSPEHRENSCETNSENRSHMNVDAPALPAVTFYRNLRRLGDVEGSLIEVDRNDQRVCLLARIRPCKCEELAVMIEYATPQEEARVEAARVLRENEAAMRALDATGYRFGDVEVVCDPLSWQWYVEVDNELVAHGMGREEALRIGHALHGSRRREDFERTHPVNAVTSQAAT